MLYKRYTLLTSSVYDIVFDVDKVVDTTRVSIFAKRISEPVTSTQNVIDTVITRDKAKGLIHYDTVMKAGDSLDHNVRWTYKGNLLLPGNMPADLGQEFYKLDAQLHKGIDEKFKAGAATLSEALTLMGFAEYNG